LIDSKQSVILIALLTAVPRYPDVGGLSTDTPHHNNDGIQYQQRALFLSCCWRGL